MHSLAMWIGRSALVLKKFEINYGGPLFVHIVARKGGLISWIFTLMGIDVTMVFDVYADRIEFQRSTLSGIMKTIMPMRSVSIAQTGYMKPILQIVIAVVLLICSMIQFSSSSNDDNFQTFSGVILLMIAVFCFLFYFLKKTLLISVISHSSFSAAICFKRSVIEGVDVNQQQALEVSNIINQLVMRQTAK